MTLEQQLLDQYARIRPAEVCEILETLPAKDTADVFGDLSTEVGARLLGWLAPLSAARALEQLPITAAGAVLTRAHPEAALQVLRVMHASRRDEVLDVIEPSRAELLRRSIRFPATTAAGVMDPAVPTISTRVSAGAALQSLARIPEHGLYYVYVVSDDGLLDGVITIAALLSAAADTAVGTLCDRKLETVAAHASLAAVVAHPGWLRFHALPVVSDDGRLVGVLRYETLRAIEEQVADRPHGGRSQTANSLGELYGVGLRAAIHGASAVLGEPGRDK